MKQAERISLIAILLTFVFGGGGFLYAALTAPMPEPVNQAATPPPPDPQLVLEPWRADFPDLVPMQVGSTSVLVSVADSLPERIEGLSNVSFMPPHVIKLFDFQSSGEHAIWMKDMKFPLDIIWLDAVGTVVHIEENVDPATFPKSFASPLPAWYVIEANAGFVASTTVALGATITIPKIE
jgi:uncharacterized membrane protein (UPF0127 family)